MVLLLPLLFPTLILLPPLLLAVPPPPPIINFAEVDPEHPCLPHYHPLQVDPTPQLYLQLGVCFQTNPDLLDADTALFFYSHAWETSNQTYALPLLNMAAIAISNGDAMTGKLLLDEYLRGVGSPFSNEPYMPAFDLQAKENGSPCASSSSHNSGECVLALNNLGAATITLNDFETADRVLEQAIAIASRGDPVLDLLYFNKGTKHPRTPCSWPRIIDGELSIENYRWIAHTCVRRSQELST